MPDIFHPTEVDQLIEMIESAAANKTPFKVEGNSSKSPIGRPVRAEHTLKLSKFSGITQYDPVELVLTAGAGTPLEIVQNLLAEQNQMLAFEPPDYSKLFNYQDDHAGSSLGGTLAGNISGPRRFFAGAARDHFLGFKAVSGRGEPFKSGGRVVKNVTGFDLSKLMAGSWGTLAALWEVTVKALPIPEKTRTLLIFGLNPEQANRAMTNAVSSPHNISGAAHLPQILADRSVVPCLAKAGNSATALRLEGPEASVNYRLTALKTLLNYYHGEITDIHSADSIVLWQEIANLALLTSDLSEHIWRLSLPPAHASRVLSRLVKLGIDQWLMDHAGGTLWLACPHSLDPLLIRTQDIEGGHATLWRADQLSRETCEVFPVQSAPLAALNRRVKNSFDPRGVLNPGRMYADL